MGPILQDQKPARSKWNVSQRQSEKVFGKSTRETNWPQAVGIYCTLQHLHHRIHILLYLTRLAYCGIAKTITMLVTVHVVHLYNYFNDICIISNLPVETPIRLQSPCKKMSIRNTPIYRELSLFKGVHLGISHCWQRRVWFGNPPH